MKYGDLVGKKVKVLIKEARHPLFGILDSETKTTLNLKNVTYSNPIGKNCGDLPVPMGDIASVEQHVQQL